MGYTEKESTDLDEETEAKSRNKGYNVQEIQHYVRQVTEQPLQLNLKHLEKNRHIKKWVYISFDNKRPIMYDHDDQVISLTLDRTITKWSGKKHWFVKQDLFRMPLHDSALLYILQLEQHPDQFKFKGQLEVVVDETDFVLDTLQAFLG